MPLHDWRDDRGWDGVHLLWLSELIRWLKPRLPEGYRAYVGAMPALTIESPNGRPDLSVRRDIPESAGTQPARSAQPVGLLEPDIEAVAVFEFDAQRAIHIDFHGQLIAAIEIVSPRNKDRPESRHRYLTRYAGYLRQRVHLLLLDVLPRPRDFSFADAIAGDLGLPLAPCPAPCAISFRVGESVPGGTLTAAWARPLQVGRPLPTIPLALTVQDGIPVDLEATYQEATRLVYLD